MEILGWIVFALAGSLSIWLGIAPLSRVDESQEDIQIARAIALGCSGFALSLLYLLIGNVWLHESEAVLVCSAGLVLIWLSAEYGWTKTMLLGLVFAAFGVGLFSQLSLPWYGWLLPAPLVALGLIFIQDEVKAWVTQLKATVEAIQQQNWVTRR